MSDATLFCIGFATISVVLSAILLSVSQAYRMATLEETAQEDHELNFAAPVLTT